MSDVLIVLFYVTIAGALLVVPAAVLLALFAPSYTKRLYASLGLGEQQHHGHVRHPFFFGHQIHKPKSGGTKFHE